MHESLVWRSMWCGVVICGLLIVACASCAGDSPEMVRRRVNSIQVIGDGTQLWIFVEISWAVNRGGSPPIQAIAHEHVVIARDQQSWRNPVSTTVPAGGVSLSRNVGCIVGVGDGIYHYNPPSLTSKHPEIYRWSGTEFVSLGPAAIAELLDKCSISRNTNWKEAAEKLEECSRSSGWTTVCRRDNLFIPWQTAHWSNPAVSEVRFEWGGQNCAIVRPLNGTVATLQFVSGVEKHDLVTFESDWQRMPNGLEQAAFER